MFISNQQSLFREWVTLNAILKISPYYSMKMKLFTNSFPAGRKSTQADYGETSPGSH